MKGLWQIYDNLWKKPKVRKVLDFKNTSYKKYFWKYLLWITWKQQCEFRLGINHYMDMQLYTVTYYRDADFDIVVQKYALCLQHLRCIFFIRSLRKYTAVFRVCSHPAAGFYLYDDERTLWMFLWMWFEMAHASMLWCKRECSALRSYAQHSNNQSWLLVIRVCTHTHWVNRSVKWTFGR